MLGLTWKSAPAPRPTDPSSSNWNKDGWGKQSKPPLQAGDKGCSPEKTKHPQLTQSLVLWSLPATSPVPVQVTSVLPKAAPHMTGQITGGQGDHSALACSEHCPQPGLGSPQPLIQEAPSTENRTNFCTRRVFLPHCRNLLGSGRHKLDSWYHHVSRQIALLDLILSLTHAPTSLCKVYCFKKIFFKI